METDRVPGDAPAVDWENWTPTERATLCFVVRNGRILLIRKKRGLGAGKVNGPGGRIEPGESARDCAIRETREELCIEVVKPELRGELHFQFVDGYALHCAVFVSPDCLGEPTETDEAVPLWTDIHAIPFDEMWADDIHWLPGILEGRNFQGYFVFDGERMLSHHVEWHDSPLDEWNRSDVTC
jgi:8-oxo-dGTP diphosphatase